MPHPPTIEFTPGIPLVVEIEFNQQDGTPLYLSDCDIKMWVKSSYDSPVLIELSAENNGLQVSGENNNILKIFINSMQTLNILNSCIFDIKIVFPDGGVEHYPKTKEERPGILKLVPRVTI